MGAGAIIELRVLSEAEMGSGWAAMFKSMWPEYRDWFLSDGEQSRPTYLACRRALKEHMPELLPTYEVAVELAGGSDLAARLLSGYRPPAYISGCSQAVFRAASPILVRNYDYCSSLWEATIVRSAWNGRKVLGMSDCLWGLLDGINESGLSVSLSFGGRRVVGDGFGIPMVLRYVLEFCENTAEAVRALCRVPSHMSYNITVLDAHGQYATVMVAPDRQPIVSRQLVVTNHQRRVEWRQHALATGTVDRLRVLSQHVNDPSETEERFIRRFLEPPVFSEKHGSGRGTLYTAVYQPRLCRVTYLWPGQHWDGGIEGSFHERVLLDFSESA